MNTDIKIKDDYGAVFISSEETCLMNSLDKLTTQMNSLPYNHKIDGDHGRMKTIAQLVGYRIHLLYIMLRPKKPPNTQCGVLGTTQTWI